MHFPWLIIRYTYDKATVKKRREVQVREEEMCEGVCTLLCGTLIRHNTIEQ